MAEIPRTDAVMTWHAEGMTFAEIGRRLGVSPRKLRQIMAEAGFDPAEMGDPATDDDCPNKEDVR
jgi:hypothetical protein